MEAIDLTEVDAAIFELDGVLVDGVESADVRRYLRTTEFLQRLKYGGMKVAVISTIEDSAPALTATGILDAVDAHSDGKPDATTFLEAARRLSVAPARTLIVSATPEGITAGRRGGFAHVVAVDRIGHPRELEAAGADLVVRDAADLLPDPLERELDALSSALDRVEELAGWFGRRRPVIFLDYDGTLSPIVERPEDAVIDDQTRETIRLLAVRFPVAVLSGRDRPDVAERVALDQLVYAGSHGFDVSGPDGLRYEHEEARDYLPELDELEAELRSALEEVPGATVDRKRYAVAVHDRRVRDDQLEAVYEAVRAAAGRHPRLHVSQGKRVHEFRPDVPWHKGHALLWLLDALGLPQEGVTAIYLGDDTTDEDAFRTLRESGVGFGVIVGTESRPTAAQYRVRDPREARRLLEELGDALLRRRAGWDSQKGAVGDHRGT